MRTPEERAAYGKLWYASHREACAIRAKAYRAAHLEEATAYSKVYRAAHKEKEAAQQKIYRAAHLEEIALRGKAYRAVHREEISTRKKAYDFAHRGEKAVRDKRSRLQRGYSLSLVEFNALLESQGRTCATCHQATWNSRGPCVDHDHTSGKVRGLLCSNCNAALGLIRDDPKIARAMVDYLERTGGLA